MDVTYCTHSTLREAYTAVVGLPAPLNPSEFDTLRTRFQREWPEHQFSTVRVLMPVAPSSTPEPDRSVPPAWLGELARSGGQWVCRWGHRTVALHRVLAEGEKYQTFSQTIRPTIEEWLGAACEAYTFADMDPPAATVVFGYINAFDLRESDGDLSEWFRFNFAIEAIGASDGLAEIAVSARIPHPSDRSRAIVHLTATQADDAIRVTVRTIVERDLADGVLFSQTAVLMSEIEHAKVLAKNTFFSFVTERALKHMGATDAKPQA